MGGLVAYESSDEEVDQVEQRQLPSTATEPMNLDETPEPSVKHTITDTTNGHSSSSQPTQQQIGPTLPPASVTPIGPILGPSRPPQDSTSTLPEPEDNEQQDPESTSTQPPLSPYTTERNLVRDLTLPPVPNMELPPSPPGSPPPDLERKLLHFLKIKKEGQHFNARLAASTAARNPSVTEKLLSFAGIGDMDTRGGLREQYETSLPLDVFDVNAFPDAVFRPELKRARERVAREREEERSSGKRGVEFVAAGVLGGGGGLNGGLKRKARDEQEGSIIGD